MSESEWLSVLGIDGERWVTRTGCRKVLVAVHTLVAGQRLLDVTGLVESDRRVQVCYTRPPDVFRHGADGFVRSIGALEIPWQQAVRERFDLALAAAYGGLPLLHAPIMVLPHGAGYAKRTPRAEAAGRLVERGVYGLGAEHLIRDGRVVPASIVLSHEDQRERLARQCPRAAEFALVAGDPCHDRLRASAGRRAACREALGVRGDQRLVVVASTWGPRSLFGEHPDLPGELVRQLDPRRYRVAALFHPAVWGAHGRRQLRAWLRGERSAGLLLVEPEVDWRGVVLAADHVVGDHGSVTAYAAAAGKPVLHTDPPLDELDPASAQAFVAERAPRLRPAEPIEPQLTGTPPDGWAEAVASRVTSRPGRAHALLRKEMYRLLDLPEPPGPPVLDPVPLPGGDRHAV
ncbi:hypothetical protein [Amycolatopsis anabasis]|uniref:hypothetical protein n=1 Tax=Amycolatopsis anabasis TaxID=1840409 RepID=UPI00131E7ADD|nr:hypothetical protein [Amycolatopsis anabasis]